MKTQASFELPNQIGILLIPGFSMLAFCGVLEPLRLVNQLLGQRVYSWRIYTADGETAQASCGMRVAADSKPALAGAPPCLLVVAGFDPWPQEDQRLKNWLRSLDRRGVVLGAVDTGSFLLASAGLLSGTATSLHWESASAFSELFPDVPLSRELFAVSGNRLLCAGGAAVLDMMLTLLERTHGQALCSAIAERLIYRRSESSSMVQRPGIEQRLNVRDRDVLRAIEFMEGHIERRNTIEELCHAISIPKRTLERKFRSVLRRSPNQHYLELRLDYARSLLRNCGLSIQEISIASGFASASHFCRTYKARFGVNAGKDRHLDYSLVQWAEPKRRSEGLGLERGAKRHNR